jgi:hypothetical protein
MLKEAIGERKPLPFARQLHAAKLHTSADNSAERGKQLATNCFSSTIGGFGR